MFGKDVGVVFVLFSGWVVCYVEKLIGEVVCVSYVMVMIAGVPDFSGGLIADCEGIAAFDVLDGLCCGLVFGWSDEDVRVVGHDYEAVELETAFGLVLEECLDEELGVGCALEVAMSLEGQYGDGVGALLLTDGGHGLREHTPGAKAPRFLAGGGPSLKAWLT
jgi:hypothetical protein